MDDAGDVLLGTANGYGKRTALEDFPVYNARRAGAVIGIQVSERNGALVAALSVADDDDCEC